jgi:hypothetical protein
VSCRIFSSAQKRFEKGSSRLVTEDRLILPGRL